MLPIIGIGNKKSEEELREVIMEYFDTVPNNKGGLVVSFLTPEKRGNNFLIGKYKEAIKDKVLIQDLVPYDYEYRKDVIY